MADNFLFDAHVLPRTPLGYGRAIGRNLAHNVTQHARRKVHIITSLDTRHEVFGDRFPHQQEGIAVGHPLEVVVQHRIAVGPDDVALPVQFQHSRGRSAQRLHAASVFRAIYSAKQITVIQ